MAEKTEAIIQLDENHISNIFGQFDIYLKKIEKAFGVTVVPRGSDTKIIGEELQVGKASKVLSALQEMSIKGTALTDQNVNYVLQAVDDDDFSTISSLHKDYICLSVTGKKIAPKTVGQKKYVDSIRKNTVVLSVGPAGTGKTYLAMAMAINAFKTNEVSRIILTRPAIEAGEKLGFLPGDLQQKVDPYLRPLYDALNEIMGADSFLKNMEKGAIEVAPLAYMRGRTLDNCFIVLDEAQNTTPEQMKMFLTRMGFGSKTVITGDITQIDLPDGKKSGLKEAISILANIEGVGISFLTNKDVVRHPLVQKIIEAYEKNEKQKKTRGKKYRAGILRRNY